MHVFWPGFLPALALGMMGVAILRDPEGASKDQHKRLSNMFGSRVANFHQGSTGLFVFVGFAFVGLGLFIALVSLSNPGVG